MKGITFCNHRKGGATAYPMYLENWAQSGFSESYNSAGIERRDEEARIESGSLQIRGKRARRNAANGALMRSREKKNEPVKPRNHLNQRLRKPSGVGKSGSNLSMSNAHLGERGKPLYWDFKS